MGYIRISTGNIEVNQEEEQRIIIDNISGEIEKVIIKYNTKCSEDIRVRIFTSDGEKIIDVKGNKNSIYYPRNWSVMNQKYSKVNVLSEYISPPNDKYVEDRNLLIIVEGNGIRDIINNIDVLINGEFTKSENKETDEEKSNDIINKSNSYKEDGSVTSNTPGVYNPVFGGRRRRIKKYMMKVLKDLIKSEEISLDITKQETGLKEMSEFITDSVYNKKFDGLSKKISDRIKDYMIKGLQEGYSLEKIRDYIVNQGKGSVNLMQAEVIARTEIQALQNAVREWSYKKLDPKNEFKYKWLGPDDIRRTLQCEEVVKRTKDGVSMKQLREIIADEADKAKAREDLPSDFDVRDFTGHFQCRHTFVRIFD